MIMAITHAMDLNDKDLPSCSYVASDIMSNQVPDYEYAEWESASLENQADLLKDIIGSIAAYKHRKEISYAENNSELLSEIKTLIANTLIVWADKEGYPND